MLAFLKTFMYNTACRHDIGLSPSGKALDSDSSISGVRIPQAQLETSRSHTGGFFVRVAAAFMETAHLHIYYYERAGEAASIGVVMIELGKTQCLNIVKVTDFGVYLGTEEDKVLLPKKQVPDDVEVGDALTVFVYRDSSDRLIATTNKPKIQLGELKRLKVSQITGIGAFLDWGLEKDLLMPYKEQTTHVSEGSEYLVALYIDKSGRLAATMRINKYLEKSETLVKDSAVTGTIIGITPDYRAYVAVEDKYDAFIPMSEVFEPLSVGEVIHGRVSRVREDGKLVISLKQKAYIQMDEDSVQIYDTIVKKGGSLGFTDKADPEIIKKHFNMSKNAFKRAVGRLLKEGKIEITQDSIVLKK